MSWLIVILVFLLASVKSTNNSNKSVSIVIPAYNEEATVAQVVSVARKLSYVDEVIVVDDGSTDNTKEEVKKINDKRVKYIKLKNNKGASIARNIGIKKAKGSFISFQDSDDYLYSNKLELQLKNLINQNSYFQIFTTKLNILYNF